MYQTMRRADQNMEDLVMLWIPYSIFAGALVFAIASAGLGTIAVAHRRVDLIVSNAITFAFSVGILTAIFLTILPIIR
jgi:hypothetical protein